MICTTQNEMINFNVNDVLGFPLYEFLPPSEAASSTKAIDKALETGENICHSYSYRDMSFLWLIERIDTDVVAIHEVIDNPQDRPRLKRLLKAASGNFYKNFRGTG